MTTDTDRLHFIETIQRLNNWLTRTRLTPAEFIKAGSNRVLFDDLIKPTIRTMAPKQPKPARKPRRWRQWVDLPQAEQDRLIDKICRRIAHGGHDLRPHDPHSVALYLAKQGILISREEAFFRKSFNRPTRFISYSTKSFAGFPVSWINANHTIKLPTNTPVERLSALRRSYFNRTIGRYYSGTGGDFAPPTFIHDLHPDDVELTSESVIVDAHLKKLHDLFTKIRQPLQLTSVKEYPLAASLFLTDAALNVEVYYCALLVPHRSAPPTLERAYLARAFNLAEQDWQISARFKRASNALQAGLKLYGEGAAAHITFHQPAAEERGLK